MNETGSRERCTHGSGTKYAQRRHFQGQSQGLLGLLRADLSYKARSLLTGRYVTPGSRKIALTTLA